MDGSSRGKTYKVVNAIVIIKSIKNVSKVVNTVMFKVLDIVTSSYSSIERRWSEKSDDR